MRHSVGVFAPPVGVLVPAPAQAECSSTLGARAPVPGPFPYINREHPIVLQGSVALPSPGPVLRAAWASGADGILGVCTPHALLLVCCVGERWQCCRQFLASIVHGEELYDFCFDVRAQTICLCGRLLDARFGAGQNATGSLVIGCLIFSLDRATGESVLDSSIVASAVLPHTDRVHAVLRDADHSLFTAGQDGLLVKAAMAANWKSVKDTTTLQAVPVGTPGIAFSDGRAPVLSLALPETHFATILLGICSTHCGRQIAVWNRSTHQLLATLPCDGHRILGVVPDQAYRQQTPNDFSHLLVLLLEGEAGQQMCTLNTISPTGLQRNHIYQCKQQELGPRLCMDVTFSQKSQSSKYLALGTATGRVALHNLSTGNCVGILCDLAGTAVDAVAFHGQQSLFATCGRSGAVNVYGQPDGAAHSVT